MTDKTLVEELRDALQAASDHLDYTGYGDRWENECAREAKLEEQIAAALKRAGETPPQPVIIQMGDPILGHDDSRANWLRSQFAAIGSKGGKKKGATKTRGSAKHYADLARTRWEKPK